MKIVNVRGMSVNAPGIVYCGREWAGWEESPLANLHRTHQACRVNRCCKLKHPYGGAPIGPKHTREEAIQLFREDLWKQFGKWLMEKDRRETRAWDAIDKLTEDSVLGCWCAPEPCHCEVIEKAWRWLQTQKGEQK